MKRNINFKSLNPFLCKSGVVILFVLVLSCAPKVNVGADFDRSADLTIYRTFSISNQANIGVANPLNAERIVRAITAEMLRKGYIEDNNNPDLLVSALTVVKDRHTVSVNTSHYVYGGLYRPYRPVAGFTTVRVDDYKDGTLVIDIIDAKTQKVIWSGTGHSEITKMPSKPERAIQVVVTRILASFGPAITAKPEKLLGLWLNAHADRQVELYADGDRYFGRIIWVAPGDGFKPGDILFKDLAWHETRFTGVATTAAGDSVSCDITFETDKRILVTVSKGTAHSSGVWTRIN